MAVTLPGRTGSRDPGLRSERLPQAADVPSKSAGQDTGLQVPRLDGVGRGLEALGNAGVEVAEKFQEAELRMTARNDAVERARDVGSYNEGTQAELRRLEAEDDISKPETLEAYKEHLDSSMAKILGEHRGSPESRLRLQERLEGIRSGMQDSFAVKSVETGIAMVNGRLDADTSDLSRRALEAPGEISKLIESGDGLIDDVAPALPPAKELQARTIRRQQITMSAVEGYLNRGAWKEARTLLDTTPGVKEMLSPEKQRALDNRIGAFEREEVKARTAGERKVSEARQILGRDLTLPERVKLAGLAPAAGDETPATKIANIETALGRSLTGPERERVAGLEGAKLSDIGGIRKEFTQLSGDFIKVRDAYGRVQASGEDASPAGDLSLIFSFMKMVDPGSVVRESEQATAQNAAGVPDRVRSLWNRVLSGERLTPEQRVDFVSRAEDLMAVQIRTQRLLERQFKGVAERAGLNPSDITIDLVGQDQGTSGGGGKPTIQYDLQGKRIGGRQ